jgi:L-seryl-tRNA(Ser) seleniumtransferase
MAGTMLSELYRKLPSVDELLRSPALAILIEREGQVAVTDAARIVLGRMRDAITSGQLDQAAVDLALSGAADAIERHIRHSLQSSLRRVINATGVILHTNLGRAPLPVTVLEHIGEAAQGYSNLEFDIATGERGKRDVHVERLFRRLLDPAGQTRRKTADTSEISTIVVNNNAAAVLLALNTLADGGEVIVSRGELVEIGGSFRIPDVMAKSGAILREVGTTNRTRVADYEHAINDKTRLLLRVHRSNFQISGFTEQPALGELVALAKQKNIRLLEDLGSGALLDLQSAGISGEPGVLDSIRAGVDVVTYSGDKLLGGPQAGLLSGNSGLISGIRANPLFRALRVDKLTYAALEATLLAYVKRDYDAIPALRMMHLPEAAIGRRAEALVHSLHVHGLHLDIVKGESVIGGGAAPSAALSTRLIAVTSRKLSADALATRLRASNPPVVARVEEGRVLLDLRTVFPEQDIWIASALTAISNELARNE